MPFQALSDDIHSLFVGKAQRIERDRLSNFLPVGSGREIAGCLALRMAPVGRERGRGVPNRISGGDTNPHFPIQGLTEVGSKSAQRLVDGPSNDHPRRLQSLADGDGREPTA
ncbi:MAG: hypothetical protein RLY70_613 [Planctomycetota bacterium]